MAEAGKLLAAPPTIVAFLPIGKSGQSSLLRRILKDPRGGENGSYDLTSRISHYTGKTDYKFY